MKRQYLITALWFSLDDNDESLDSMDISDFDPDFLKQTDKDIAKFIKLAGSLLDDLDDEQVGHDFWLTRNKHSAGFWDGDYEEEVGRRLTEISGTFLPIDLYVVNNIVYGD